jgi:chemotaxis protein MotB
MAAAPSTNELAELLRRQAETSRLSQEQQLELNRLTDLLRQQQQVDVASKQREQEQNLQKLQEQAALVQQQRRELEQLEEIQRRALALDSNNRDLHAQLAQTQQQNRVLEDQIGLLKQQLNDAAGQLAQAAQARQMADQRVADMDQRFTALNASMQKRTGATIRANSSPRQNLQTIEIAGLTVRQDGDVVRIELPSDQLFSPQTAMIRPEAATLLDQVAVAVGQNYPRQMIGIEAHTDSSPIDTNVWTSNKQLSAAQAMATHDYFMSRHRFSPRQLFVLGHGENYPLASNGTPAGQQRNRRVEVVIYPETVDDR